METSESREVRIVAYGACALVVGVATASAILAYKIHKPRASDCADWEECYGYAGAVLTFLAMCAADIIATAVVLSYMALTEVRRAAVIAYAFAVATAVTGLVVVVVWFVQSHPPPSTLPTLLLAGSVFALTVIVVLNVPYPVTIALGLWPLTAFGFMTLLALSI